MTSKKFVQFAILFCGSMAIGAFGSVKLVEKAFPPPPKVLFSKTPLAGTQTYWACWLDEEQQEMRCADLRDFLTSLQNSESTSSEGISL